MEARESGTGRRSLWPRQFDAASKHALKRAGTVRELCYGKGLITEEEMRSAKVTFRDTELLTLFKYDEDVRGSVLRSDIIAEVGRADGSSLFLVIESQTRSERGMALRMDRYLHQALDEVLSRAEGKMVEIQGIVFHVLAGEWRAELTLKDYLGRRGVTFPGDTVYLLYDQGQYGGEASGEIGEYYRKLRLWAGTPKRERKGLEIRMKGGFGVLLSVVTGRKLDDTLVREEGDEDMYAEMIGFESEAWEEGFGKGRAEGRVEGRVEGQAEGELKGVRAFLDRGIEKGLFNDYLSGLEYFDLSAEDYPGLF